MLKSFLFVIEAYSKFEDTASSQTCLQALVSILSWNMCLHKFLGFSDLDLDYCLNLGMILALASCLAISRISAPLIFRLFLEDLKLWRPTYFEIRWLSFVATRIFAQLELVKHLNFSIGFQCHSMPSKGPKYFISNFRKTICHRCFNFCLSFDLNPLTHEIDFVICFLTALPSLFIACRQPCSKYWDNPTWSETTQHSFLLYHSDFSTVQKPVKSWTFTWLFLALSE